MAKLTIPRSNEQEKAVFAKLNITLREEITVPEFEAVISDYLKKHNVLHLATCRDNEPRSTPLEYFNHGLTVYILSEGGGKFANLKANQKISYSICDPYDPSRTTLAQQACRCGELLPRSRKMMTCRGSRQSTSTAETPRH